MVTPSVFDDESPPEALEYLPGAGYVQRFSSHTINDGILSPNEKRNSVISFVVQRLECAPINTMGLDRSSFEPDAFTQTLSIMLLTSVEFRSVVPLLAREDSRIPSPGAF
jgi:hypothetical protein